MDNFSARNLSDELAEDLGSLEAHCRRRPEMAAQAAELRLAAALVRNCLAPFLDNQPATPLHLVVVGGAGAGKSTIVNLLTGVAAAEANPQAGFTRHPVAFVNNDQSSAWPARPGFLGPLTKLAAPG